MRERIINIRAGEEDFSERMTRLYDDYYKALVGYSMQIVDDLDVAKDIVQTLFQKIWELHIDVHNELKVKAYLYNGVRNMSLNSLRHKNTEDQYVREQSLRYEKYVVNADGDEEFFTEEVFRLLFKKIDELPTRQREVFLLCMEGKSYKEIGKALNIGTETVKTQKKKAILKLKKELGELSFLILLLLPN
ncbi:MAG: RNA polymerase sigma-70 factor [Prevotella sp.]|nr:RNA polymerase sigma-70 factor [Prevotella sp.]